MKKYKYILCLLSLSLMFSACSPDEGSKPDIGGIPQSTDIRYSAHALAEDPNSIEFIFENEGASPYWSLISATGEATHKTDRRFVYKYLWAGDYEVNIQMYNKGGLSDPQTFPIKIAQNSEDIYKDKDLINLTGGKTQKIWVWDKDVAGHLGCGEASGSTPNWWSAAPNEQKDKDIYDDELSFVLSKYYTYNLVTHGKILVNETAAEIMDPVHYPHGSEVAVVVDYTQPEKQSWSLTNDEGKLYLQFSSKAFPSYVANPDALGGKYEVIELTESTLYLKWKGNGNGINWYFRFKVKD